MDEISVPGELVPMDPPRHNPPAEEFAPREYIAAQLMLNPPSHLSPIQIAALPIVPQFGPYLGLNLITKSIMKVSEMVAEDYAGTIIEVPIRQWWPLWGYWVVGNHQYVPIVKPNTRPTDEGLLQDKTMKMPLRYAEYSSGNLGPWKLKQDIGGNIAVQVLFRDIFTILWYLDRRVLYDPLCLDCLYPREWTDLWLEMSGHKSVALPDFQDAVKVYTRRTANGDLDDSHYSDLLSANWIVEEGLDVQVVQLLNHKSNRPRSAGEPTVWEPGDEFNFDRP
ncbi:hypothetical protein GGR54DRAFT_640944 [Hypoxylon sp. NC1633]|nr:hypothetical protein GGR54DRAFT_640944 [Hypoxylon sp. NC1633]